MDLNIHIQTVKFRGIMSWGIMGYPNSPTSQPSELLMTLLKLLITKIKSHVKDVTDFLNKFNRFSHDELDIILVTVDIYNMYISIKQA